MKLLELCFLCRRNYRGQGVEYKKSCCAGYCALELTCRAIEGAFITHRVGYDLLVMQYLRTNRELDDPFESIKSIFRRDKTILRLGVLFDRTQRYSVQRPVALCFAAVCFCFDLRRQLARLSDGKARVHPLACLLANVNRTARSDFPCWKPLSVFWC